MRAILSACSLTLAVLGLSWVFGLRVNATASMPRGVYRLASGALERGDLVSVCLEEASFAALALERGYLQPGSCPNGLEPLLKHVAGLSGDRLDICPLGIMINGRLQPRSQAVPLDSRNRPMSIAESLRPGPIPDGMALVLSDHHPGSFDSRYFGLVPLASLQRVDPVFLLGSNGE